ncbi:calmodulin binding protein PICBP-like [Phragmites australis]|uniref:calmodulin binding protein PICBP-like n=1 Tax=Phragmites australis TaxID=29695 RepID=UPI002D76E533|nr:calmodulin binding protein PICBP-like [Phragmites australis]
MVRSKEVPKKKPKDPLLTPLSKPRGGFLDEGRPRNRGGTAISPTPASVPNYMRGTSSSDAKTGRRARPATAAASASAARRRSAVRVVTRGKVLFPEVSAPCSGSGGLGRATCSSTMKEAKFPTALDLAPGATDAEGPAAMRVCPYTYCSLNGHTHAPAVPLRSFLASRRRLIKTQQSMKLKGISAFRKKSGDKNGGGGAKVAPLIDEEAVGDFFVEVYAGPRVSSDMSCSDMSLDEMDDTVRRMEFVVFDRCGTDEDNEKGKDLAVCRDAERLPRLEERHDTCRDSLSECSGADIAGDFVEELPWTKYHGYEYDSLDDEISKEQRVRNEETGGAEISEEQEDEGASGRWANECDDDADEKQEANDEENILDSARETEIVAEHACRVEACEEPDGRDEGTAEEISDDVYKSEIPDEEVAGRAANILEESCGEETSADREAKDDEFSVESDGESEVTEEQDVKDEDSTLDDGSEMEISEDTIARDGRREDFSEEVTSRVVPEDDGTGNKDFEQYVSIADDVVEQDGNPANGQNDAQKEMGITEGKLEVASEETAIVQPTDQDGTVDGVEDGLKELESTTCKLEEASEESGIAQESNSDVISTCVNDGDQMEPENTACISKDASKESGVTQESNLIDNAEYVTDGAEMGPEITGFKLEDASEDTCIDQETVEDDDSTCVNNDAQIDLEITKCNSEDSSNESVTTHEDDHSDSSANVSADAKKTVEDDDSACISDDAQNDLEITKCKSEDASKESVTTLEADQNDSSANVSSDDQNASDLTATELAVIAISEDTENESKLSTCKSEDVFEEFVIVQEASHDDASAYVNYSTQNESEVTTCESEGAQKESDVIQEDEDEDNSAGAPKKSEITACESGDNSEKSAMPQEADGHVNTIDASDSTPKDVTMPKYDAHTTEETNQSSKVQILEHKYDCSAEGHAEPQNIPAEFTDAKEPSIDDICGAFSGMTLKGDVYFDPAESATCPRNKLIISRRRRTPEEEEYLRDFNPRAPNFLPLELDPDAEKVDLKHQMMDERKNAEEWMIDYALRRALTNLAPARKKKVELLVQAFETVLPHDEDDKKSITPTRSVQICN